MRIDAYLYEKDLAPSRTKAKELVESGRVSVNGKVITKPAYDVSENDTVTVAESDRTEYVGRGGIKLEAALDSFCVDVKGAVCADIGASTGGFTDCLLRRGAVKVFAIDSGTGQLSPILEQDSRVVSLQGVNARYINTEDLYGEKVDVVVMDVSFISKAHLSRHQEHRKGRC